MKNVLSISAAISLLLITALLISCGPHSPKAPVFSVSELSPGGLMTSTRISDRTFITPGASLSGKEKLDFWTGFSLFRDPWVIAPSSTQDRDGLGPLFNTRSCISCHLAGARGPSPIEGISKPSSMVIKLGMKDSVEWLNKAPQNHIDIQSTRTYQYYGKQIQPRAIQISHASFASPLVGEAKLSLSYDLVAGQYEDGTPYQLRAPKYQLVELAYGDIEAHIGISPRMAPPLFGTGLLDAISEEDLLSQADEHDTNQDGISARYAKHSNVNDNSAIGRFGVKATHVNLKRQVAAAFRDDIGITSSLFPDESCSQNNQTCHLASQLGGHTTTEIPDKLLDLVFKFNAFIAVPPTRNLNSETARKGREIFYQANCHSCHTPSYQTDKQYPIPALAGQTIWPYTDLALHDMGPDLADNVRSSEPSSASGREWRTPPLWGLGLRKVYQAKAVFLHDGRAQSVEEAILWHGGEALSSQQYFKQLDAASRTQLLTFLDSI
jgi:CxxC motif-containing protein (DUF1111 family)